MDKLSEIQKELHESRIESMKVKLETQNTIHKVDSRLIKIESQWKIVIPFVSVVFTIITSFVKTKLIGKS